MSSEGKPKFSLAGLLVVASALFLLALVLVPAIFNVRMVADMTDVGARGRDIYITIVGLSTIREPLGLTNVWPKTRIDGIQNDEGVDGIQDIGLMTFQNSTDYFYELYLYSEQELKRINSRGWSVSMNRYFDYSLFAGAGVPRGDETKKLRPENNIWCIAGDLHDYIDGFVPVLVTRDIDCGSLYRVVQSGWKETLQWSQQYKPPRSKKMAVIIYRSGAISYHPSKYAAASLPYPLSAPHPPTLDDYPPVYLTPDSLVTRP